MTAVAGWPSVLRAGVELFAGTAPLLFAAVFLVLWWRARRAPAAAMARAVLAPVLTAAAYLVGEASKTIWEVERPCRTFAELPVVAVCPEVGDWSFPSNHAVIAGAAAVGIILAGGRRAVAPALLLALAAAASRVLAGVHYPHDVLVGLLLGAGVAALGGLVFAPVLTPVVERLRPRAHPVLGTGCPARSRH